MGWAGWMNASHSLERQVVVEAQRRQLQAMPVDHLRATADSLLTAFHERDLLLRNAMRRIAELEIKQALLDCESAATKLRQERSEQSQLGTVEGGRRGWLWWRR